MMAKPKKEFSKRITDTVGFRAWSFIGVFGSLLVIYFALSSLSSLVVPLIVAVVVGALFVPIVDYVNKRIPRKIASVVVLIGLIVVVIGSVVIVARGIADQSDEITTQLTIGVEVVKDYADDLGVDIGNSQENVQNTQDLLGSSMGGFSDIVVSAFSGFGAFLAGTFVGLFILYYVLTDWSKLVEWLSTHLDVPKDLGEGIIDDAIQSVRGYFSALSYTSFIAAVLIGVVAAILGVPLAFAIALITFLTSFIPYAGAFIAGTFAVLIALGSGGLTVALILLAVILLSQLVVQPLLENKMTASELDIHPAVIFGATIVGTTIAGVLGAILSAPVVSMVAKVNKRVKRYQLN